jgi:molybdopterin-guanine dinucleotide biosynthesis protein MobB
LNRRIFGITGWKNSGKTTLTERLVSHFAARGLRVATVKHAHHSFDIDHEGTDSWRHRHAGSVETAIVSSARWAIVHELRGATEPGLDEIISKLSPCDLILVEGFKNDGHPKIECRRAGAKERTPMAGRISNIVAIASDDPLAEPADPPAFSLDDIEGIAKFIADFHGIPR